MKFQLSVLAALAASAPGASGMMMDYAPLQCNADAVPSIESQNCLSSAASLSSLLAAHGSSMMPLTIPCGTCAVVDHTDGSTIDVPGGINVLGRLHFPPASNVVIITTAVFVQGLLSAEEPSPGNKVKISLYGNDDVTFYPHEECCSGMSMDHRGLGLRGENQNGNRGRGLMQNGCDMNCEHKKNASLKPIVVAGGKLDIRAVDASCPSWTVLSDVKSTAPPPFASGCSADGSILRGNGSFESGVVPTGMTGGVLQTETVAGVPNKYYKVANRVSPNHGVY